MSSQEELRSAVTQVLKTKGLTQTELCRQTGLKDSNFANFLSGRRKIALKSAEKYFFPILSRAAVNRITRAYKREKTTWPRRGHVKIFESLTHGRIKRSPDQEMFATDPINTVAFHLFELESCDGTIGWFAERLSVSESKAEETLELLRRLEIVSLNNGIYSRIARSIYFGHGASRSGPEFRKKLIERQRACIEKPRTEVIFEERFCAIDPKDINEFREFWKKKNLEFDKKQIGSAPKKVYVVSCAMFPAVD